MLNEIRCMFHRLWTHLPENIERATFYNRLFLGRNGNHPSYAVSSWRCSGRWLDLHIQVMYRLHKFHTRKKEKLFFQPKMFIILIIVGYAVDGFGAKGLSQRFHLDR